MSVTSALVLFASLWFLILLMLLPVGVQSQQESGRIVPGTPPGAPAGHVVGRKLRWTTIVTCIAFAAIYGAIEGGLVTRDAIAGFAPF